jgi:hypothetical protein
MKLTTIALAAAAALVMSASFAFAQAGDGDAGYAGRANGGYYGARGFSGVYGYGTIIHTGRIGRYAHWSRRYERREEH